MAIRDIADTVARASIGARANAALRAFEAGGAKADGGLGVSVPAANTTVFASGNANRSLATNSSPAFGAVAALGLALAVTIASVGAEAVIHLTEIARPAGVTTASLVQAQTILAGRRANLEFAGITGETRLAHTLLVFAAAVDAQRGASLDGAIGTSPTRVTDANLLVI